MDFSLITAVEPYLPKHQFLTNRFRTARIKPYHAGCGLYIEKEFYHMSSNKSISIFLSILTVILLSIAITGCPGSNQQPEQNGDDPQGDQLATEELAYVRNTRFSIKGYFRLFPL